MVENTTKTGNATNNTIEIENTTTKTENTTKNIELIDSELTCVSNEKLNKYFSITGEALEMVKSHEMDADRLENANDFLDMAERYYSDAHHFQKQGNFVLAFAALNYAHGWLDAGARIGLFKVHDSRLFTVDDE